MIKYVLAFILLASPGIAGMGIGGFPYPGPGMATASVPSSSACNSATDADVFCEDFEGTGYVTAWAVVVGSGSVSPDNVIGGTFSCTDKGTADILFSNVTTTGSKIEKDLSGGQQTYSKFYFRLIEEPYKAAGSRYTIYTMSFRTGGANYPVSDFQLYSSDGTTFVPSMRYTDANGSEQYINGATQITAGTWYEVGIRRLARDSGNEVVLYFGLPGATSTVGTGTSYYWDVNRIEAGGLTSVLQNFGLEMDIIKVDTTAMPGSCQQ